MKEWRDVTETFSEAQRHYKNTYLEICEVYGEEVEVSFFSSMNELCEIYISWGRMYGIIYVQKEEADAKREEVKKELQLEYEMHKELTREFINAFCEKYGVRIPNDIFFDASSYFDMPF